MAQTAHRPGRTRTGHKVRVGAGVVACAIFLFPVPDLVIYVAGMGTTPLRWLAPAILLARGLGVLVGSSVGTATAHLPASFVMFQWVLLLALSGLAYRYQRPLRYHLLVNLRRTRRTVRGMFRTPLGSPAE